MLHKMKTIRSEYHQVSSYEINKISLSCYDDKRNICYDDITSYAYGHFRTWESKIDEAPFVWQPIYPVIKPHDIEPQHRIIREQAPSFPV